MFCVYFFLGPWHRIHGLHPWSHMHTIHTETAMLWNVQQFASEGTIGSHRPNESVGSHPIRDSNKKQHFRGPISHKLKGKRRRFCETAKTYLINLFLISCNDHTHIPYKPIFFFYICIGNVDSSDTRCTVHTTSKQCRKKTPNTDLTERDLKRKALRSTNVET